MQQSYGEAFAEVVSRSVIPRSTGLGDHGQQLRQVHTHHPLQHTHYTATHTQKYSTEKKHKICFQLHKTHKNTQSTAKKQKTHNRHTYPTFLLLQLNLTYMKRILGLVPVKKIIFTSSYDWPSVESVLRCISTFSGLKFASQVQSCQKN